MKNEFRTSRITVVRKYIKILFLRLHSNFGLSRDEGSGEKMRENKMARKCTKVLVSCICLHMINLFQRPFALKFWTPRTPNIKLTKLWPLFEIFYLISTKIRNAIYRKKNPSCLFLIKEVPNSFLLNKQQF